MTGLGQRLRGKLIPRNATVVGRTDLTEFLVEIWCTSANDLEAGQVLAVRVDGSGPGPAGTWRRYTIAETTGHAFRLLIQRNPTGIAAHLLDTIKTGDTLTFRGPEAAVIPPPSGNPLLIVADLSGLGTIAALSQTMERNNCSQQSAITVFATHEGLESTFIAGWVGVQTDDLTVHRNHGDIENWIRTRSNDNHTPVRLLAIGEHDLTQVAKRAALAAGVQSTQIRTRTYWKPGRRGLE